MNKNELITLLRNPNDITASDLSELEEVIESNPYFLNGRLLLAKASKKLKHPETKKRVSTAAVYATDRPLFKKYLSDQLFFLSKPPEEEDLDQEKPVVNEPKKESVMLKKEALEPKQEDPKQEKPVTKKSEDGSLKKSVKSEGKVSSQKEETKTKTDQQKPKREPRFDPSATASFKRRWDVKNVAEESPKPSEKAKPKSSISFAGKKIDRSNRVKKKSIRDEILNETASKNKSPQKETKETKLESEKETVQNTKVEKQAAPKVAEKRVVQKTQIEEKTTPKVVEKKETPKTSAESSKASPQIEKESLPKKAASSKSTPQKRELVKPENKASGRVKIEEKLKKDTKSVPTSRKVDKTPSHSPEQKVEQRAKIKVSRPSGSKSGLKVPEVPSGSIDSILEELKRDMEDLRSSRVKFAEVQQKIEEEDAVSAAVEKATKNIPKTETKTKDEVKEDSNLKAAIKEEVEAEDRATSDESIKEEKESSSKETKEEKKAEKNKSEKEESKKETKLKKVSQAKSNKEEPLKGKKSTPNKKKGTTKKNAAAKKTVAKKTESKTTTKSKAKKTKSTKKADKKDDDTSGKQKVDQSIIIDKFIAETPSIKYQKKSEPVQNQDLSGESTEWNKELASEYLAEIYLHQGNKKRAIEIYKALSLKFPNKKSYFADLISKTK